MRHRKAKGRTLGRRADHRKAMVKNLAEALIAHGRIETTVTRAKEVRSYIEKLITKAREGSLHARRLIVARLHTEDAAKKLFEEIAPKYASRPGGYTRVIKTGPRRGDAVELAVLEFVEDEKKKAKKKPAKKGAKKAKADAGETTAE